MKHKLIITIISFSLLLFSCTKLDEKLQGNLTPAQVGGGGSGANVEGLLKGVYDNMRGPFQGQEGVYGLWETTTDELEVPTRGPDWDDNGVWRAFQSLTFTADHPYINNLFNDLNSVVFSSTELLRFNPTPQQAAEARMLRAMASFMIFDGWDQLPYREPGGSSLDVPKVRKGQEALDYIMSELTAIIPDLPVGKTKANKNAAKVLLMKCYLNKGTFANRAAPTFDAADMQKVITLADSVIAGGYTFSANYFDNFAPANTAIGKENIWVQENVGGVEAGGIRSRYHSTIHYNQPPGGWNGFSTLSDFYAKFEPTDVRRGVAYPANDSLHPNPGKRINVGFLEGQQYDLATDKPLHSGTGAQTAPLLIYTPEVHLQEGGDDLEVTGIRVFKYAVDWQHVGNDLGDNDYVYFRLADVMLMKAEALLRTDAAAAALPIVNTIRANRGATPLASVTLDNLIDERGRELYTESWRREDLIRFGKFLGPRLLKPEESDPKYLLFPIPNRQVAANPNLTQNPGY